MDFIAHENFLPMKYFQTTVQDHMHIITIRSTLVVMISVVLKDLPFNDELEVLMLL